MKLETALTHARDTKRFETGRILDDLARILTELFPGKTCLVIGDENTMEAAGARVVRILKNGGVATAEPFVFPGEPTLSADYENTLAVSAYIERHGPAVVPLAVGSGTINDLVKVAAFEAGLPYAVVATAASVDGYTSPGASLVKDGFKNSIYCKAPLAVVADGDIIRSAPHEMSAAGYADLSSKLTAGSDWIIADAVGAEAVDPTAWEMVQPDLRTWLDEPGSLTSPESPALDRVMYGLTMTGLAMQFLRRSRPASGAEHLMSHIWEMRHHTHNGRPVSHGFQVAIGTLACTALTECVFSLQEQELDPGRAAAEWARWEGREAEIRAAFGPVGTVDSVIAESRAKYLDADSVRNRVAALKSEWNHLASRVTGQLFAYERLAASYREAGCPTTPAEIGLGVDEVVGAFALAGMIRNRYTVVDLATELGVLDRCIDRIVSSPTYLK